MERKTEQSNFNPVNPKDLERLASRFKVGPGLGRLLGYGMMLLTLSAFAQMEWLDQVENHLQWESPEGNIRTKVSGILDMEGYYIDQEPPALISSDDTFFFNPRLSLFLDAEIGEHIYAFAQVRADQGFDPDYNGKYTARFDEYLIRYKAFSDEHLNFQVGKFATVVGNWTQRHDSWNNPFINAPLAYENVTTITDKTVPGGPAGFLGRKNFTDNKHTWLPLIWGPADTSGLSVFGTVQKWSYAFAVKNASISSSTSNWDGTDQNWSDPTYSGRIGYRPNMNWNLGSSFSVGPYLKDQAVPFLSAPGPSAYVGGPATILKSSGKGIEDYLQITLAQDISFEWHHLQLWGELFLSRFEVPNVGDADTMAYFLETKYKFSPSFSGALRWNQQLFDEIKDGTGGHQPWDRDAWRVDTAAAYRFNRHLQGKLQYSYFNQNGEQDQGEQMIAAQLTLRF